MKRKHKFIWGLTWWRSLAYWEKEWFWFELKWSLYLAFVCVVVIGSLAFEIYCMTNNP